MDVDAKHRASTGLVSWAVQQRKLLPRQFQQQFQGIRFAFYGRMSTVDFQDKASSWRWQRSYAEELIADHGRIVAEFFDEGVSRRVAWPDRTQAGSLLAAIPNPDRGFEAVVVGEFERAFHGQQLSELVPLLQQHNIELWLPETYGPVEFDNPRHLALMDLLGVHSRREISRARYRTTAAMTAQAQLQGRHLGGRPPFGYMLVDAGPHPNRAHARWGRRLNRLEPDPATAPAVRWIFAQRLEGRSVANITRQLNDDGVPCPSHVDRERNQHRSGEAWMLTTVLAILSNPRYTGRQVWNRQRTDRDGLDPHGAITRHEEVQRWNLTQQWAISEKAVHPPLVSEEDFVAVQSIHTAPVPADGTTRSYTLAGLVFCGICGRIMDSHWAHGRAAYRCRHGHNSTRSANAAKRKILYLREDQLVSRIQHERNLHTAHPELRDAGQEIIADYLATRNMIIVCDHGSWVIETEAATIQLTSNAMALFEIPAIPAQRATICPTREGKS